MRRLSDEVGRHEVTAGGRLRREVIMREAIGVDVAPGGGCGCQVVGGGWSGLATVLLLVVVRRRRR